MKKIFRMALVFALAGATLMYTGCTKDYSEDINKLSSEISSLENEYKALSDELATLKSGVASLEAAYKAADTALENKFNGKIDEIQKAIDKKADKSYVEEQIEALRKEALEAAEALEKKLDGKFEEAQKLLDEAIAAFSNELRALVFVPDFYYAGVEATEYSYANFVTYKMTAIEKATPSTANPKVTYNKGAKLGSSVAGTYKDKGQDKAFTYTKGSVGIATFDMNPSTFPVENAEWSMVGQDKEYIGFAVKGEEPKVWAPKVIEVNAVDGNAEIGFQIENYDLIKYFGGTDQAQTAIVPVIQAVATLEDGKTISSDWGAVLLGEDVLNDLAFAAKSDWTTEYTHQSCPLNTPKQKDLYASAEAAITPAPSVNAIYNGGSIDLGKEIAIHMKTAVSDREEVSLADFVKNYPGFKYNFELVSYTIGDNKTSEDLYGKITSDGVFTPCYVDENGKSVEIAKDGEAGISAVGRAPMVLVQLVEPEHELTVNWGYFRIEIAEKDPDLNIKAIDVKDFGTLPYLCNSTLNFKWYEFSAKVLEALKIKYQQFFDTYKIEEADGAKALVQGSTYTPQIYVKNGDKYEIAYVLDKDGKATTTPLALGTITYKVDATGEGVNDAFTWTFDKAEAENLKNFDAVYVLFQSTPYDKIAFKLSYKIADPAQITFGEINPTYWFKDIEDALTTVRANVLVPNKTDDHVEKFEKNLDDYFVGNKVKVLLKDESKEVYGKYFDGQGTDVLTTTYSYKFAAEQPVINGVPFVANPSGSVIFLATYDSVKKEYTKDDKGNYIRDTNRPIAKIEGSKLTYLNNKDSQDFLNLWGINETEVEKMLYANIQINYSASDCNVAADSSVFHVRFVRPLTITSGEGGKLVDGLGAGSEIALGYLFNAFDWNGLNTEPLFAWHAKTEDEDYEGFVANTFRNIVWYTYYGISAVKVDCANALTNQTGEWKKLKDVNNNAILALYNGTSPDGDGTASGITTLDANNVITGLTQFKLHYENNQGVANDFALKVPIEVSYKWGTVSVEVEVPVQGTQTK
ncbi:MAG: hypothetical protein Q4G10_04675 [Bacteroidia bacterium]|nr:hypothetical protein [Bacteroidia bacterium]